MTTVSFGLGLVKVPPPEHHQQQQQQQPEDDDADPATRAALNALREQFDNSASFISSLLSDTLLKHKVRLIVFDLDPLHQEYALAHAEHALGQEHFATWASERSLGRGYLKTVCDMTTKMVSSMALIEELDLIPLQRPVFDYD